MSNSQLIRSRSEAWSPDAMTSCSPLTTGNTCPLLSRDIPTGREPALRSPPLGQRRETRATCPCGNQSHLSLPWPTAASGDSGSVASTRGTAVLHGPQDDQKVLLSLEEQGHCLVCHVAPSSLSASLQVMKAGGGRRRRLVLATEVPPQGSPNLHCLCLHSPLGLYLT